MMRSRRHHDLCRDARWLSAEAGKRIRFTGGSSPRPLGEEFSFPGGIVHLDPELISPSCQASGLVIDAKLHVVKGRDDGRCGGALRHGAGNVCCQLA